METTIKIRNEASLCTIDIEGVIGVPESEQFGQSSQSVATYERFREVLEQIKSIEAEEVLVNIRSTGGDVNDVSRSRCPHHHSLLRIYRFGCHNHCTGGK